MKSHNGLAKKENFLETPIYKINEWCKIRLDTFIQCTLQ